MSDDPRPPGEQPEGSPLPGPPPGAPADGQAPAPTDGGKPDRDEERCDAEHFEDL